MQFIADGIEVVCELSTVVVRSLCGEPELSNVLNSSNVFFLAVGIMEFHLPVL